MQRSEISNLQQSKSKRLLVAEFPRKHSSASSQDLVSNVMTMANLLLLMLVRTEKMSLESTISLKNL